MNMNADINNASVPVSIINTDAKSRIMCIILNKQALGNRLVEKVDSLMHQKVIPCFRRLLSSLRLDLCAL